MMENLVSERLQGLILAFTTIPRAEIWLYCAGILLLFLAIAATIGFRTGFLRFERMEGSRRSLVALALLLVIQPALLEETIFRGLLVPHPAQGHPLRSTFLWAVIGLVAFILSHPLNGLFIRRIARSLFTDPIFLFFAGLVGVACTVAYLVSGSIWPPMLIHWAVVTPWILFFGGGNALFRNGHH
jgi:predicted Abi (CAAX) family protease